MSKKSDYRLRITQGSGTLRGFSYIVRKNGHVLYQSADETPLALSNLIFSANCFNATEVRFALEDAKNGPSAARQLQSALEWIWKNNKSAMPRVEVL